LCLTGIALRIALALLRSSELTWDERDYDEIARSLLGGRGFSGRYGPTAFRPPGQPVLLALVYGLAGHHRLAVVIVQAVLLGVATWAARGFARAVGLGPVLANAVAVAAALHPGLAYASTTLYPTALTAAALTLGGWWLVLAIERDSALRGASCGAALGIAGAATTYLVALVPFAVLFALFRRRVRLACTLGAIGLLPAAAWVGRNAVTLGGPVLSTQGGYNLALGAHDQATPRSGNWIAPALARERAPDDELARDLAYRTVALTWIREHPGRWALLFAARAALVLDSSGNPRSESFRLSVPALVVSGLLSFGVALSLFGLWRHRRRAVAWVAFAPLLLVAVSGGATLMKPRFRFPCDPLLASFAVAALRGIQKEKARCPEIKAAGPNKRAPAQRS